MLSLLDYPPLIRFSSELCVPLERRWLEASLRETAQQTGVALEGKEGDLVESVFYFFRWDYPEATISPEHLTLYLRRALEIVGQPELARAYTLPPPPFRFSLLEMAEEAAHGYELGFFAILSRRLRNLLAMGVRDITFEDLRPCVKRLCQAQRWRQDCRSLGEEIVAFIRAECVPLSTQESSTAASASLRLALF